MLYLCGVQEIITTVLISFIVIGWLALPFSLFWICEQLIQLELHNAQVATIIYHVRWVCARAYGFEQNICQEVNKNVECNVDQGVLFICRVINIGDWKHV